MRAEAGARGLALAGRGAAPHLIALVVALVVALAVTWPLPRLIETHSVGEKFLRSYYLFHHIATHGPLEWWRVRYDGVYFPTGGEGIANGVPLYVLGGLFARLVGFVAGVNLAILAHVALTGYAGWRLSRRFWAGRGHSELVHLAVAVGLEVSAPSIGSFASGQPENLGLGYVLLAAEGTVAAVRSGRLKWFAVAGAGYALAFAMTPYLCMGALMAAAPCALARPSWRALALGLLTLAITAPFYSHYSATVSGVDGRLFCPAELPSAPEAARTVAAAGLGAVALPHPDGPVMHSLDAGFLLAPIAHAADGGKVEDVGTLGWTLIIALIAYGFYRGLSPRSFAPGLRTPVVLLSAAAVPLLAGMGSLLFVFGWVLTVNGAPISLPLGWFRDLPMLGALASTVQYPARLINGALLPLWLLAAELFGAVSIRRPALGLLLVSAPLLEQQLRMPLAEGRLWSHAVSGAHRALAKRPEPGAVLDIPPIGFETGLSQGRVFGPPVELTAEMIRASTVHGHPVPYTVGCYDSMGLAHPNVQSSGLNMAIARVASKEGADPGTLAGWRASMRALHQLGFRFVVLHTRTRWSTPEQDRRLRAAADATLVPLAVSEDGSVLYSIEPPAHPGPEPRGGR